MKGAATKRRVAIYRNDLLPLSETFIRAQALGLKDWHPILVGRRHVPGGLSLDGLETRIVPPAVNPFMRLVDRTCFWLDRPIPELYRAFASLDLDLVHVHFGTDATTIWPSVRAANLPMLVTLHGKDINIKREWWESGRGGLRRRVYPRRLLQMSLEPQVRFIAVSEAIKQRAIEYGIPEDKITVHYIGIDTERFKPGDVPLEQRRKRILFVGRMVEKKAPLQMIRAYAQIRSKLPDAELVMIGSGPLLESAKQLAGELGVPAEFRGACSSDEVIDEMHRARVFCLPSITAKNGDAEGFGMVLLEAQACGIPVVSSARGGAEEGLVDGRTGFSFPENDLNAIKRKIENILTSDDLFLEMSMQARKFIIGSFEISSCIESLEHTYLSHHKSM